MFKKTLLLTASLGSAIACVACGGLSQPAPDAGTGDAPMIATDAAVTGTDVPVAEPDASVVADRPPSADLAVPPPDAVADLNPAGTSDGAGVDASSPNAGVRDGAVDGRVDSSADAAPKLALTLGEFEITGALCGEGQSQVFTVPDAFTMVFDAFVNDGGAQTCRVAIELGVPVGYQFSSVRFDTRGFVGGDDPTRPVLFEGRYSFEGRPDSAVFSTDVAQFSRSGPNDDFILSHRPIDLWSPSCDGQSRVRLLIDLTGNVPPNDLLAIDSFDGTFTIANGLEWRRCGETQPIRPPPGEAGEDCDGVNKLICGSGLVCELGPSANLPNIIPGNEIGQCVDPAERLPPQAKNEQCAGHREIPCAAGLVCWSKNAGDAAEKRLGFCTAAVGADQDSCGGFPAVPCAAGLTCYQKGNRCVRDTGALDSPCGEGLRACNPGLRCDGINQTGLGSCRR
jgi:hypothetical protein